MDMLTEANQISAVESQQVKTQLRADLVEHLYKGSMTGIVSGFIASVAILFAFYQTKTLYPLAGWFIIFNIVLISIGLLYYLYTKQKHTSEITIWEKRYAKMMLLCAALWGTSVYFMPDDVQRQYLGLTFLLIVAAGYAIGTVGELWLCFATLCLILGPYIIWCALQKNYFYTSLSGYLIFYISFLLGINQRSTQWLKDSLKLKLENSLVTYQANHDLLTDLPNQRLLLQYMESALTTHKEQNQQFAIIRFAINRLGWINDSLGPHGGDAIIQAVADRLKNFRLTLLQQNKQSLNCIITLSRENIFTILMTNLTTLDLSPIIKNLLAMFDKPFFDLTHKEIKLTASMGASLYPQDGTTTQSLLTNADAALTLAKQDGGNRFEFYSKKINAQTAERLEIENSLYAAVKNQEFVLHYQPLLDLHSGKICGAEALVRWNHPQKKLLSPFYFISIAEEIGLIAEIEEWIFQEACRQTYAWHKQGFNFFKIAINLSPRHLSKSDVIKTLGEIITNSNLDPKFIELEITETAILDESAIPLLTEFKKMGLSLAADDFGTGYSGLSHLKRFAIDKLKIDQSFVKDIEENNDSATIVSAIIAMAKELKIKVLAEGIETKQQLQILRKKGCDFMQGYYFSKPVPQEEFTQLLLHRPGLSAEDLK